MKHDVATRLYYGGDWHEAPAYVRKPVTVSRGLDDEKGEPSPGEAEATLDNRSGDYNPRNPASALYGLAGRNTPAQVVYGDPVVVEDFEDDTLNFSVFGGTDWFRTNAAAHTGSWSWRAGAIGDSQQSSAFIEVPDGATCVRFWYKVSSEEGFDKLRVYINSKSMGLVQYLDVSGEVDWTQITLDVTDAWDVVVNYIKDSSLGEGDDTAYIDDVEFLNVRHTGEIASWKPDRTVEFDGTKGDAWTDITASGVLRRLEQGNAPTESLMRRDSLASAFDGGTLIAGAYWPCEDGTQSTQIASALPGGQPITVTGPVSFAQSDIFPGSAPLPVLGPGGNFFGPVNGADGRTYFRMSLHIPSDNSIPDNTTIVNIYTTTGRFGIAYGTGGLLRLDAINTEGALVDQTLAFNFGIDDVRITLFVELRQFGSNTDYLWGVQKLSDDGLTVDTRIDSGTFSGITAGRCWRISGGGSGTMDGCTFGHIGVGHEQSFMFNLIDALRAYAGETAGDRFLRLCAENSVDGRVIGDPAASMPMGPQYSDTLPNLLAEIVRTDGGLLFDMRGAVGLLYRTRQSLYNQDPALTVDWEQLSAPSLPVLDDKDTRNDVTAKRRNGSSYRLVRETGPLNVNLPADDPEGVGRYKTEIDVNPAEDASLRNLAGWYLNLGTVDEQRFPKITVDLDANPELAGGPLNSNPYFETTTSPWTAINGGTLTRSTAQSHQGVASALLTPNGVTNGPEARSENVQGIVEGTPLIGSAWVRCAVSRNVFVAINWRNSGGSLLSTSSQTEAVVADTWTRIWVGGDAPANATQAQLVVGMSGSAPANNLLYIDEAALTLDRLATRLNPGDLIVVNNPPTDVSPGPLRLLAIGDQETIGSHSRKITFTTAPETPYQVGVYDESRYASKRTYRHSSSGPITTTSTGITFRSDVPWVTDPDQFPFDVMVSGEQMTVTAIGTAVQESNGEFRQLWTVIRSVNGVVKAHPVGVTVQLADPRRYAL
jgi:hypothetical protein